MVIVTHNHELASMMHRTLRLVDGQLREESHEDSGAFPSKESAPLA